MGVEFFLEIGCEEIPARFLANAAKDLSKKVISFFDEAGIDHGKARTAYTPRRLALTVADVQERQPDKTVERTGPAKKVAFDADGNPTKAALGFAKGQGATIDECELITTDKGEYLFLKKSVTGQKTRTLLSESLPGIIQSLHWPKSMKWGALTERFVRPVHWITALLGDKVLRFELFGLRTGSVTYGHRFLAPAPLEVTGFDRYVERLRGSNVISLPEERREIIQGELERIGQELVGTVVEDPWLVDHVSNLVEYPVALTGTFPEAYLELPREILITSMRDHQKYFVVEDASGDLLPRFITISNMLVPDPEVVIKGNQRVLVARLEDARFYFEEDLKIPLDKMADGLTGVVFQADLGTYAEKTERTRRIAKKLCLELSPDLAEKVDRAVALSKVDLVSGVVGEFPELQGIMGAHYARYGKEANDVATAIFEHYLPKGQGADLPKTETGALTALADKFDSICGCFGVGLAPTGSGDPFALRRLALGVIHILEAFNWSLDLPEIIAYSVDGVKDKIQAKDPKADTAVLTKKIVEFFRQRLANLLKGDKLPTNTVDSVLSVRFSDMVEVKRRAEAVAQFAQQDQFEPFAAAFLRVANILATAEDNYADAPLDTSLFEHDSETKLLSAVESVEVSFLKQVSANDILGALATIAKIRPEVDSFFDDVLVMAKDEKLRINRLVLLDRIGKLFREIADFKKL